MQQSFLKGRRRNLLLGLALVFITVATYLPTRHYGFVRYDDDRFVAENPHMLQGVTPSTTRWAFTAGWAEEDAYADYWRPLSYLSHLLDAELFGLDAGRHHLMSTGIHAAAALALFWALLILTGLPWRSAFIAALFALHPLRVESVAWISERKDVLSGLFFFLTIGAYAVYARRAFAWKRYLPVIILFVLALMSKPTVVTLPCVLLLLDIWPLDRFQKMDRRKILGLFKSRVILEKIPLFVLSGALSISTWLVQHNIGVLADDLPLLSRITNALISYATYIGQTLYPAGLVVFYPYNPALPLWKIAGAAVILMGITGVACWKFRKAPYLTTGWLWYLGTLVTTIGLFTQTGSQAHADRYTYIPSVGLYIMATWGLVDLSSHWKNRRLILGATATVLLVACISCTRVQISHWRDSQSLWEQALAHTTDNYIAENGLGNELAAQGKFAEAIERYQRALEIMPDDAESYNNMGVVLNAMGKNDDAVEYYQKSLQFDPEYSDAHNNLGVALAAQKKFTEAAAHYRSALQSNPNFAEAHNNLALSLTAQTKLSEAIEHYRLALRNNPNYAEAHNNLGTALATQGKFAEAIGHYQQALRIDPNFANARKNLGLAQASLQNPPESAKAHCATANQLLRQKNYLAAIKEYEWAIELDPNYAAAKHNLAWLLATCPDASIRNGKRAVELARSVDQLVGGRNPGVLDTLSVAYAEAGQFPEAISTARRALTMAASASVVKNLQMRLRLYEAGVPFHEK